MTDVVKRKIIPPARTFCPQPMYIIGTYNENGSPNFSVVTWISFTWNDGPHITLSVGADSATARNITRNRAYTACLVTEDNLWLADYFGSVHSDGDAKTAIAYGHTRSEQVDAPLLDDGEWIYECAIAETVTLDGSYLFISGIACMQVADRFAEMEKNGIDLREIHSVIYAPRRYFSIGKQLGMCGQWKKGVELT